LKQPVDGPQTVGLVTQPLHTVAGDVFIWSVAPKGRVNLPFNCALRTYLFIYLLHFFSVTLIMVAWFWTVLKGQKKTQCSQRKSEKRKTDRYSKGESSVKLCKHDSYFPRI